MVLAIAFFTLVFSTILWLIFALNYIYQSLGAVSFASLGIVNISVYAAFVLLPVLVVWLVFGFANQYLANRSFNHNMFALFKQMKRNQEYSDLVSRVLLEAEQHIRDGFMLSHFDLLIADLNELIAELISRSNLATSEQIEHLWGKVQNGGKWAFAKVIVEINQNQPNFQMRIFEKSCRDLVLAGTVMEFCARYQSLVGLLEKHDKERVFLNMIETGVYGKVFAVLAPVADEIRKHRNSAQALGGEEAGFEEEEFYVPREKAPALKKAPLKKPGFKKPRFVTGLFKKKAPDTERSEPQISPEKDPFSAALERSFGEPDPVERPVPSFFNAQEPLLAAEPEPFEAEDEPHFEIEPPAAAEPDEPIRVEPQEEAAEETTPEPELPEAELTDTQRTLNELKKEWETLKQSSSDEVEQAKRPDFPVENKEKTEEPDAAYPFGGWTDEGNYHQ